jgi:exopolysaccharide biosynthesis polyprenyl glycosylphosphotransferase
MLRYIPKKKLLLLAGDVLLIYCACLLAPAIRFQFFFFEPFQSLREILIIILPYLFCFYIGDLYNFEIRFTGTRYMFRFLISAVIATWIVLIIIFFFPKIELNRGVFVVNAVLISILTYLWRLVFEMAFNKYVPTRQKTMLIIGAGKAGYNVYKMIKDDPSYKIAGFIDDDEKKQGLYNSLNVLGNYTMIDSIVSREYIDTIIIAIRNLKNADLLRNVLNCKIKGIHVYNVPSFYEEVLGKIQVEHLSDLWFLNIPIQGVKRSIYNTKIKRLISIVLSSIILALSLPILLLAMITIRVGSGGPIFYRQKRVGFNETIFEAIKFRTMKIGTENDREFAGRKDDPRITKVGRFVRFFRIDELPQMWNVLKGEMNLIGPRALMVEEVKEFETKVPYFTLRHSVKPGITGWAQVNYPHGATVEDALEKLKYDLFYIKNLSPFLDFHILLRTIRVVLFGKGAR